MNLSSPWEALFPRAVYAAEPGFVGQGLTSGNIRYISQVEPDSSPHGLPLKVIKIPILALLLLELRQLLSPAQRLEREEK